MFFLYRLSIGLYYILVFVASFWNVKAKKWLEGRKNLFSKLGKSLGRENAKWVWFHTASLGEFEQARPVIEVFRKEFPGYQILVTFFSPSGFEVRKNTDLVDLVAYLPLDTPSNARKFVQLVKPMMVFFVKYEFWYFHLMEIQRRRIPSILFSSTFRPGQLFFRWYGGAFKKVLQNYTHIFVQEETSLELLKTKGLQKVSLAGDTRFDRVWSTASQPMEIPLAAAFKKNCKLLAIGSCWEEDLDVLMPVLNNFEGNLKVILAPHEIHHHSLQSIERKLKKSTIRYSQATLQEITGFDVLLIDNIGLLAALYQYADFAFVGGAFRQGLHNILEPAVFGIPVIFGPEIKKYPEALELCRRGGAFTVKNPDELKTIFEKLYEDDNFALQAGKICKEFIQNQLGGSQVIIKLVKQLLK